MDEEKTIQFAPGQSPLDTSDIAVVRILSGPLEGQEYRLIGREYIIGRDPISDIVIEAKDVSRRHAKIEKTGTEYTLSDLGSSNGVYVNNLKLPRAILMSGDMFQIGSCVFQFVWNRTLPPPSRPG